MSPAARKATAKTAEPKEETKTEAKPAARADQTPANVHEAISIITGKLSEIGIAKGHQNKEQNFVYRGIDDVYAALAPLLAKYKITILPVDVSLENSQYTTKRGTVMNKVQGVVFYQITHAPSDTSICTAIASEGMDAGDKATNKAMSGCYKYHALQAFCIPVEGQPDPDAEVGEQVQIVHENQPARREQDTGRANTAAAAEEADEREAYMTMAENAIAEFKGTEAQLREWWAAEADHRKKYGLRQNDVDFLKAKCAQWIAANKPQEPEEDPFA